MSKDLTPIREALAEMGTRLGLEAPLETATLWQRWDEIAGPQVAAHAQPAAFRSGELKIVTDSPAWATELGYMAEQLKARINEALGGALVTEIKIARGPLNERPPATPRRPLPSPATGGDGRPVESPEVALERARAAWSRRRREAR